MAQLEICLLGTFQITHAAASVTEFSSNKVRALLAYLVVESDRPHRRDALAGLLWPESTQETAMNSLRNALANLRGAIGDRQADPPYLLISRETIQFNRSSDFGLDVAEVMSLPFDQNQPADQFAQKNLQNRIAAVNRYRGPFLEGFSIPDSAVFEEWTSLWRERIARQMIEGLRKLANYYEKRGEIGQALKFALRQVEIDPWMEEGHTQLMRLYALSGHQQQALRQFQTLREILKTELDIEPSREAHRLYEAIQSGKITPVPPQKRPIHNLPPPLTTLIGRDDELYRLQQLLRSDQNRLVTVTGVGGTGKTRLVLEVSRKLLPSFSHGIFLVEISSGMPAEFLLPAIAQAIGLDLSAHASLGPQLPNTSPQAQLWNYLQEKTMLLVLDSFESILDASGQIYDLLQVTSQLKIFITSRSRLNLVGEKVFPLEGLSYPSGPESADDTTQYAAVSLFADIARRSTPDFNLTPANRPAIAEICLLAQGMPLAILLAASWSGVLNPTEIHHEIQRSLDFLASDTHSLPDRQRSIRATFEYSWGLLAEEQRSALRRLSIFPGIFSATRASQVSGVSLTSLKILIDQSLLQHNVEGFRMHDLLHEFTREKQTLYVTEAQSLQRQFCRVYLDALAGWSKQLRSYSQLQTLAEMNLDQDNFRLAWDLALRLGIPSIEEQALDGLCRYFLLLCRYQEGLSICQQSEQHLSDHQNPLLRTSLQRWQATFLNLRGERKLALKIVQPLVADLQNKIPTRPALESELAAAGLILAEIQNANPTLRTLELAQQSLRIYRTQGSAWHIGRALCILTHIHDLLGNRIECFHTAQETLEYLGQQGDPYLVSQGKYRLAFCYMLAGDYESALELVQELVSYYQRLGDRYSLAKGNRILAHAYWYAGQFKEAENFVKSISRGDQNPGCLI